jgi:hypothetical protein
MTCALDDRALEEQFARFGAIGDHVLWSRRLATELTVVLDPSLDDDLLAETLAVERGCCPFFALIWDEATRELTICAREQHESILGGIAAALGLEQAHA